MLELNIQHPLKHFLLDVTTEIDLANGIVGIFGESGAGKSTLLKCISGIVDEQKISLNKKPIDHLLPEDRPLVYQPQQSVLFPHLTVEQNLQFMLKHRQQNQFDLSLQTVVDYCHLQTLLKHKPEQLSGGETQRAVFARTLLAGKSLILLDEPFSALDSNKRQQMQQLLIKLNQETGLQFVLVSHSLQELAVCCTTVLQLENGKLINQGEALSLINQISQNSNNGFSILACEFVNSLGEFGMSEMRLVGSSQKIYVKHNQVASVGDIERVRIDANKVSLSLSNQSDSSIINSLQGIIENITETDSEIVILLDVDGQSLTTAISKLSKEKLGLEIGQSVFARFKLV